MPPSQQVSVEALLSPDGLEDGLGTEVLPAKK